MKFYENVISGEFTEMRSFNMEIFIKAQFSIIQMS